MNDPVDIRLGVHVQFPTDNFHARCTVILLPVMVYKFQYVPLSWCHNAAPRFYGTRTNQENIGYVGWWDPSEKKIVPPPMKIMKSFVWNPDKGIRWTSARRGGWGVINTKSENLARSVSAHLHDLWWSSTSVCVCMRVCVCVLNLKTVLWSVRQNRSLEIFLFSRRYALIIILQSVVIADQKSCDAFL